MNSSALWSLALGSVSAMDATMFSVALIGSLGGRSMKLVAYSYADSKISRSCVRVHLPMIFNPNSLSRKRRSTEIGRVLERGLQNFTILRARPLADDFQSQFLVAKKAIDGFAVGHEEAFHGFTIFFDGRTSRDQARRGVIDALFREIGEQDETGFFGSEIGGRSEGA